MRGTIFELLVRSDRIAVALRDGGVDLTLRAGRVYVLDRPNTAITIWGDGRVNGPHDWSGSIIDFAALAPPPVQRRAAPAPAGQKTAQPRPGGSAGGPSLSGPSLSGAGRPATPGRVLGPGLLEGGSGSGNQGPAPAGRPLTPGGGGGGLR